MSNPKWQDHPVTSTAATIPTLAVIYLSYEGLKASGMEGSLVFVTIAVLASFSWLLSGAIKRWIVVSHHKAMSAVVASLGLIFLVIEASIVHVGIEHLLKQGSLEAHWLIVWFVSGGLSIGNVFTKWGWLGDPGERQETPKRQPATGTGPTLVVDNRTVEERRKDDRSLAEICKQVAG
ncbi:MAG: hypothetical protein WA989_07870 [Henriciella sp.]|uniref:hypothetical protein n=1 Tax=Henriciella sp. TaxID=1968823 RepID=UPI003C747396